jgi:hypothetical protein
VVLILEACLTLFLKVFDHLVMTLPIIIQSKWQQKNLQSVPHEQLVGVNMVADAALPLATVSQHCCRVKVERYLA